MSAPMENVLEILFQQFTSPQQETCASFEQFLVVVQSNKLFSIQNQTGIQDVLSHAHNCLRSSKNKMEGLVLLGHIVHQSTTEVFQQNALTWTTLMVQILQSHYEVNVYRAACQILGKILYFAKRFTDISREIISSVLPQLVPLLLTSATEVKFSAISCISSIIQNYPGPLGPFKNKIEAAVLSQIDESTTNQEVLRCFALLSQCGPGGSMGVKHAEAWVGQCQQVIGSLDITLGSLYEGLEADSNSAAKGRQKLPLRTIDPDKPNMVASLVCRWTCLTACLQELLRECPDATVKLPAENLLQLVCRCLAINSKMLLNKPTTERLVLASHLLSIHTSALSVLKQLIVMCRSALIAHAEVVVGLMSQELVWTATDRTHHMIQYGQLRECVYEILAIWLKVLDGNSCIHREEKSLVKQILHDCAPMSETLKLVGQTPGMKAQEQGGSKKKKHRGYQEISQGISSQRKVHQYADHTLVSAALDALYWMVLTSGTEMEKQNFQAIQSFCVKTLLNLQQAGYPPVPYGSADCRRNLYRVLHACTVSTHGAVPPPTQCAYGIFRAGLQDTSLEVSSFCIEALRSCEVLIHPRAPCLNGPIRIKEPILIDHHALDASNNDNGVEYDNRQDEIQHSNGLYGEQCQGQMFVGQSQYEGNGYKESSRKRLMDNESEQDSSHEAKQARKSTEIEEETVMDIREPEPGPSASGETEEDSEDVNEDEDNDSDSDGDNQDLENNDKIETEDCERDEMAKERVENDKEESGLSADNEMFTATKLDININNQTDKSPDGQNVGATDKSKADEEDDESEESGTEGVKTNMVHVSEEPSKQSDDREVDAMLMTFVEAGPDSD